MKRIIFLYSCLIVFFFTIYPYAQTQKDSVWKTLYNNNNVRISFIFYSKADNYNNGVVVKLENSNKYSVTYNFKLIFRADTSEIVQLLTGSLREMEKRTGSSAGLFFIPFKDQRSLSEVGIKGCKITPQISNYR